MTNESGSAEEGLFTLDPEDQDAVAEYFGEGEGEGEGEEVPEVEGEEHELEHVQGARPAPRRVRIISISFFQPQTSPPHPVMLSPCPPHSVPLSLRRVRCAFCAS